MSDVDLHGKEHQGELGEKPEFKYEKPCNESQRSCTQALEKKKMAGDRGRHKERKRIFGRKRDQGLCSIFPEAVPPLRKSHEERGRAGGVVL